jgi:hypothetical protein
LRKEGPNTRTATASKDSSSNHTELPNRDRTLVHREKANASSRHAAAAAHVVLAWQHETCCCCETDQKQTQPESSDTTAEIQKPKRKKTRCFCDQTNSRAFRPSNGTAQLGYPTPAPRSCTVAGKRAKGVPMLFPNSIEEYNCLARTRDNQPEDQNQKRDRSNQLTGAKGIVEPVRERARSGRGRVPSTRRCCQS